MHSFCRPSRGETYVLFMKYHPRSEDDELKTKKLWMKGHTDIGTVSILYSQPVAALQTLTNDGTWNSSKMPLLSTLEIHLNSSQAASSSQQFTESSNQHSAESSNHQKTNEHTRRHKTCPLKDSPVLQRVGITSRFDEKDAPTMEQWRKGRTSVYGLGDKKKMEKMENGEQVELVNIQWASVAVGVPWESEFKTPAIRRFIPQLDFDIFTTLTNIIGFLLSD
ncbi:hypothetical protein BDQ17DRAFT_1405337 [Cyathus striatus]|nr:hypothetical protein BDQ17DRAFT_1405337 [Cyathus striatus]